MKKMERKRKNYLKKELEAPGYKVEISHDNSLVQDAG